MPLRGPFRTSDRETSTSAAAVLGCSPENLELRYPGFNYPDPRISLCSCGLLTQIP